MELVAAGRVRVRATLLWLTATAALAGLGALTLPPVRALTTAPGPTFADALVQACSAAALVAGAALWVAATDVVGSVLRTGGTPPRRGVGPLRRLLLAACGVAVLAGTSPAAAEAPASPAPPAAPAAPEAPGADMLDGLPLPDRPVGRRSAGSGPGPGPAGPAVVVVRPGDSLWTIAAHRLGPGASQTDVASYWLRVRALNAAVIGPDHDLIRPGQSLRLPPA
ncbi:LysM peptidoglycan-binding domain-containing protein [Nocardioides carbamazepini]|uniref:LysM peptidoglycan-binding domain-containing protein n=1 Tax=Nocardioides carbamazepini TaxID=2854259 RepID=UPI00214A6A97|nr:LysM peptidoglycan-binding domain-containing protein [Nocardioides carbamazepini]MCR1782062.1 LysM peptidoglycan-binding domain-containing protein [Nocardioides carbamazepini]